MKKPVSELLFVCVIFVCNVYAQEAQEVPANAEQKTAVENTNSHINVQDHGLAGLLTMGLMGGAMALYAPKRQDLQVDRSGYYEDPALSYAQRIKSFDDRIANGISRGVHRFTSGAKKATRRIKNSMRRAGQRSLNVIHRGANAMGRMAHAADRSMRGFARTASRGLRRISSRLGRAGASATHRMGETTVSIPVAAMRGLYKVSNAYGKGIARASGVALDGLVRAGKTYKRGITGVGRLASGLAGAYSRGVSRIGSAAKDSAYYGVDRLGELASQGAATIGGLATDTVDRAFALPKSLSNVAKDKKMRDCLLQAMCYISTPFIDPNSNYVKRSVSSQEYVKSDIIPDLSEDESAMLKMEDCEAFKCEVVSLGRQAYDLVAKSLREEEEARALEEEVLTDL